jgi:tRNA dimethylallyltransferase
MTAQPRMILIAGPTASGKSALALRLAERLSAAIVNADSMQVYRDLRILTSRPGPAEEARAPHLLYGHVDAADPYSVGRYLADARRVIAENANKTMIFVGGTGLYFDALTKGLSTAPPIPDPIRSHWREQGRNIAPEALHAELSRRDPVMAARLRPSDPQRIIRALEVIEATGISLAEWQGMAGTPLVDPTAVRVVLTLDRAELRARIAARFDRMVENGALDEVRRLLARNLASSLPAMKALGVPELGAHLKGISDLKDAVAQAKTHTQQYAKRQETWLRNRLGTWVRVPPEIVEQGDFLSEIR